MRRVEVVCHRGANALAPENTFASARRCLEWDIDFLEIDVNYSADGVPFVFHGPDLTRTTNGRGRIFEHPAEYVDALDAGSWFAAEFAGERVPRLDRFLDWLDNRVPVFFDVKWAPVEVLAASLRERMAAGRLSERSFFWFGRDTLAREFVACAPDLRIKINVRSVADVVAADERFDAAIVELALADLTPPLVEECRARGVQIMVLQKDNDAVAFERVLAGDVDLINLDHADAFLRLAARL